MFQEGLMTEKNEEAENLIEDALRDAGFPNSVKAPSPGTSAYERLMVAARGYMTEVKKVEQLVIPVDRRYSDRDDYFNIKSMQVSREREINKISSSDTIRRKFHDTLANMLLGKPRTGLSKKDADQLSNFAAYVTGNQDYIDKW